MVYSRFRTQGPEGDRKGAGLWHDRRHEDQDGLAEGFVPAI